jgi:cytoskeletal protein RodZ
MSFGRYLQSLRLEKGISLERVSKQTRISLDNLLLLEKEDHANLPVDVFNKGFLRAYAEVLNVDSDDVVQRYVESREVYLATLQDEENLNRINTRFWPRLLLAGLLLLLIVPLSVYLLNTWRHSSSEQLHQDQSINETKELPTPALKKDTAPDAPKVVQQADAPAQTPPASAPAPPKIAESAPTPPLAQTVEPVADPTEPLASAALPATDSGNAGQARQGQEESAVVPESDGINQNETRPVEAKLKLSIEAVEETWMKVVVDGVDTREYMLKTGERVNLSAQDNFNLLIGNAAGVQMTLNEEPVAIPGKSGQVVTLQLP